MARLHPCCIHCNCNAVHIIQKVLFLDDANAKSLITSSKSTERSMSASMQSTNRESIRVLDSSKYSVQALMVSVALYCLPWL